jgi:thiamine kinase-like enzyme
VTAPPSLQVGSSASRDIEPSDAQAVERALDRAPAFGGRARTITRIAGGLTNRSYRVDAPPGPSAVVRLAGGKSELLAIDRAAECNNSRAASSAGVAPRVLLCDPDAGVSVVEWIAGRTLEPHDLDDPTQLARVAALCRQLHQGPRFVNDFDMFVVQRDYLEVVRRHGFRLPARYDEFAAQVELIAAAVAVDDEETVPCHNDLLAANIMDDGERLWFIDYEYSGNNDACFELGNIWSEAGLPPDRLTELVTAYYGRHRADRIARARLFGLMSKYGWTLWAAIQDAVSEVDFDFWSWGMEKYERAVAEFDGPEFQKLITQAQQPT